MITSLNLIFARADSYTALVGGNEGEHELVISCSPCQDGRVMLSMMAVSFGGGATRLLPAARHIAGARNGFPLVQATALFDVIRSALFDWGHSGGEPTQAQREHLLQVTWNLARTIVGTWGAEDLSTIAEAREQAHPYP